MTDVLELIRKSAADHSNRIAYKLYGQTISYAELLSRAELNASMLKRQGTSPVIIYGHKEIDVIISILSCLIANRAYVPVDLCTPKYRLEKIVELTGATLILTNEEITVCGAQSLSLSSLRRFENLPEQNTTENKIAYMIFTSGSTGEPKGVPISRDNLCNFVRWISSLSPLCSYQNVNVLNQASFSFDLSVADFYYSICNGHTLLAFDSDYQNHVEEVYSLMKETDVAVVTPTFIKLCLISNEFNAEIFSRFKCVYFCGETLENQTVKKLLQAFPNLSVINAYGPTEATSAVSAISITPDILANEALLPVGDVNNFATDIEIINDEIVLKGKSVFGGYISGLNGGHFVENGVNCYKTGDIGFIKDGKLYCKGRADSQIKYKGYRIELNDIESNIATIKGVKECAVVDKRTAGGTVKLIKAFVVLDNTSTDQIRKELAKKLPSYMIPKAIIEIKEMPINQNGKTDRKALREL